MRKQEFYTKYRDQFEYSGYREIKRIRIKNGKEVRYDWFVFQTSREAMSFFKDVCGSIEGRYPDTLTPLLHKTRWHKIDPIL